MCTEQMMGNRKCSSLGGHRCRDVSFVWRRRKDDFNINELLQGPSGRRGDGGDVMKMGVTTQLASQAKLSLSTSCVGYSTSTVMNSEQGGFVNYLYTFTPLLYSLASASVTTMCLIHISV